MKKYEMIPDKFGLYRIRALIDIPAHGVEARDLGGLIEKEDNLSHDGECWIHDNAMIHGDARICDNAQIYDDAEVYGGARICGNATVHGNAAVYGNAKVYDNAEICGNAIVYGNAEVYDNAEICDYAEVYGNAKIKGDAWICGEAWICGDARITKTSDYIVFKNFWSSGSYFTWTRSNNMWKVGDFYGTGEELIKKAYADSEISGREYERVVKYVESILEDEK